MSMRRHLTYANVTATLALIFAMGGSAIAAKHYLISSTKQIKPSVLKSIEAHATGAKGATGAAGPAGPAGSPGSAGKEGAPGLSALSTLPSGVSESGIYDIGSTLPAKTGAVEGAIDFPVPLAATLPHANVAYNKEGQTSANCPGAGKAARGFLCIYASEEGGTGNVSIYGTEPSTTGTGSGRFGAGVLLQATDENPYSEGSWTVTAP